jgi:hypothetical protein
LRLSAAPLHQAMFEATTRKERILGARPGHRNRDRDKRIFFDPVGIILIDPFAHDFLSFDLVGPVS